MPSCSCPDWKMSAYPCKHFFAIFKKYSSWGWNSLSKLYKNSPYLTLDKNVTDSTESEAQPVNKNENDEIAHRENETIAQTSDTVTLEELPSKKMKVKNRVNGDTCRSLLNDVKSFLIKSFLIKNDQEKLNRVFSVLQNLKEEIECDLPKEKGIPLMPKRLPNSSSARRSKKQLGQIPLPKRKTSKLKRVGEARERFIRSTDLKITDERKRVENENVIVEHLVDENVNCDSVSSFNMDITNRNKGKDLDESMQANEDSKHNEFKENLPQKTPRVNLTVGDLSDLSHNRMLYDNIIQTFQQMLKIQYPDANGLQDPVLGQALSFAVYQTTPFVQVLHDGSLHWIAISTYNCKKGEAFLMDSMFHGRVAHQTKRQICSILNSDKKELKIVALPVQQ